MTWEKAHLDQPCGNCGALIKAETALLRVSSGRLVRCVRCAKDTYQTEPPMTWPISHEAGPQTQDFVTVRRLAAKAKPAFDAKLARTGEQ